MSPSLVCLLSWLLPVASGSLWARLYLPPQLPAADGPGSTAGPGDPLDEAPCSPASPCAAAGHFCDEHFGLCLPRRPLGHFCRRDPHCAEGLLCMFGRCQQPVPRGQDGARCQRDEECGAGGCCARQHGQSVCQRRLELGRSCLVPAGGLAFSINQLCPCQAGLLCRPSRRRAAPEQRPEKSDWRCQRR